MDSRATLTFWYEFGSTYSYPAIMRIGALAEAEKVKVTWRPFLLGPIFKRQGWHTSPFNIYEAKGAYMWRDLCRICEKLNLPFERPDPFPQNGLMAARIATVGLTVNWGEEFTKAVFMLQFGSGGQIDDEMSLSALIAQVGGDPEQIMARARSPEIKEALKQATAQAAGSGIFGAPSFVASDGELFWGNDRLEDALAWAKSR